MHVNIIVLQSGIVIRSFSYLNVRIFYWKILYWNVSNFEMVSTIPAFGHIRNHISTYFVFFIRWFLTATSGTKSIIVYAGHVYILLHQREKWSTIQYGYRKRGTHARVFSQTLTHGYSKNEIRQWDRRRHTEERREYGKMYSGNE